MPELPEVETVRLALLPALENCCIIEAHVGRPDLRWPLPEKLANRLVGRIFGAPQRRGKFLLLPLDGQETLLLHLGMSGSIRLHESPPELGKHDHFMLSMAPAVGMEATIFVVFNDPRRFGWIDLFSDEVHPMLAQMGPEPLGNMFSDSYLATALANRSGPVKTALLNQQLVAGIGNIYACEALFYAGISPRRKAGSIKGRRAQRLTVAIRDVLKRAIAEGGTSLRDHVQPGGEIGYFVQKLAVYGREGEACDQCDSRIRAIVQSGRSSFYCSNCQR
jgi:formamidopyrimidine-DNA glycosylase